MLYIILLITCSSTTNECVYVATQHQDLTLTQCEKILPSVQQDLPTGTRAECVLLDLE